MLLIISAVIIMIYTILCLIRIYQNKEHLQNMTGMVLAMMVTMVSATAIGLVLGIHYRGDLTTSTIFAMNFSLFVGILAGKPINLLAIGESVGMGAMGGMMGAMIGDMIPSHTFTLMVIYIVVFSVVSFLFIIHVIHTKAGNVKTKKLSRPWSTKAIVMAAIMFTLVIFGYVETVSVDDGNNVDVNDGHHHHHH